MKGATELSRALELKYARETRTLLAAPMNVRTAGRLSSQIETMRSSALLPASRRLTGSALRIVPGKRGRPRPRLRQTSNNSVGKLEREEVMAKKSKTKKSKDKKTESESSETKSQITNEPASPSWSTDDVYTLLKAVNE